MVNEGIPKELLVQNPTPALQLRTRLGKSRLGPIRMPADAFEQVGTIKRDGKELRQFRMKCWKERFGVDGPIWTEEPMDEVFELSDQTVEPLKCPELKCIYYNTVNEGGDA